MGCRGPDWSHEETLLLAQMKQKAVLSNKKERVWMYISIDLQLQTNRARSEAQCQRRWDTLKKVYKKIEAYCAGGSEDAHRHLDQQTLDSLELATAYREDWYTILKQVCLAEEERRLKKRKKLSCANTQGIRHPPTNNNNNPTISDQAITPTAPNAHEAIVCSPTVEAQSSSTEVEDSRNKNALEALVMQQNQQFIRQQQDAPAHQVTPTAPNAHEAIICSSTVEAQSSSTEVEDSRYKNEVEALLMQGYQQILQQKQHILQQDEQILQQKQHILQQEQQLLQQNQQIIQQQQNAPAHQTIQWPFNQLDLRPRKKFKMPSGDSAGPGKMMEFIELPAKCFSPEALPSVEGVPGLDVWRIILQHGLTQFSGQHDHIDSATNLSTNPALFGRQSMPQSQSTYCDERETTLTIHARFTSKETQMVSTSNQVTPRSLHADHEKPASIELHISARTNVVANYHELSAELQRLKEEKQQQQLWEIQQSQVSKPVTISSNSAPVSNEKPFNPRFAETNQPTTDGLTELVAQMSLLFSQRLADPPPSQSMGLAKSTLTPGAMADNSSQMCVTDPGIHKSSSAMVSMKPKVAASH